MNSGPPRIFDRNALRRHDERAQHIAGDRFLLREAVEGLGERLSAVRRTFFSALELSREGTSAAPLHRWAQQWTVEAFSNDEVLRATPGAFDLVISILALHSVNDLPGVLVQARRTLKPDGLFLAVTFGGDTVFELKESLAAAEIETRGGVSPRVAPFADVRDLGALLQRAGFALPVTDVERTVVRYGDFAKLVADLRAMGETNALAERNRSPLSRATLAATLAHYATHHAEPDGRLRATFDLVYLTGWAPDASQQRPLKPGSARARLADALKTTEYGAGEPTPKR